MMEGFTKGAVKATVVLRADTLPDFNSVLEIIKTAGLSVSIEEVVLKQEYIDVKAPSVMEIKEMIGEEEEHF